MYEQNDIPVLRRMLFVIVGFVVLVAVIWFVAWLIFFRSPDTETKIKDASNTNTSQKAETNATSDSKTPAGSSTPSTTTTPVPTPTSAPSSASTTTQPSELVNTGAGSVVLPVVSGALVGSALFYTVLRRKALQS